MIILLERRAELYSFAHLVFWSSCARPIQSWRREVLAKRSFGPAPEIASARTTGTRIQREVATCRLRGVLKRDDGQMPPPSLEVDLKCKSIARLSSDEHQTSGAGRAARPTFTWFDARSSIGRSRSEVDLVGCLAI